MNLIDLEIEGFGVWSGLKLDDLSERLTAFYGPNEAGKTTLLQFLRTVLYGFSPERRRRYLPPLHGGRAGGTLQLASSLGKFTVSRYADVSPRTPPAGELRLADGAGAPQNERLLDRLLGRIDEPTFNNVFAVGLREMQELGALNDTAAGELLYGLSTGLDRVSLVDVLRELKASRERLLSSEGKPCQIVNLLSEREKVLGEIDELRSLSHRYAALAHQRSELDADVKRHEEERTRLEHATRIVEAAISVRDAWGRRAEIDEAIAHLSAHPPIEPLLADQIETINKRLGQRRDKLAGLKQERIALRKEVAALGLNRALARCAPRIEALQEQETWIGAIESQVEQLAAEATAIETQLAEQQQRMGGGKDRHATIPRIDERTRLSLRPLARALREPQARLKVAQRQLESQQETADRLAGRIREALADRDELELAPALERAGELVSQLRRRAQVDERLSQMAAHDVELVEQGRRLEEGQLLPAYVLWFLGVVFAIGLALFAWGGIGWIASRPNGLEQALFGLLFCVAAGVSKYLLERSKVEELEKTQSQSASLVTQIRQAREERAALDAQLPRGAGPWLMRLQAAEKDLAALEDLMSIDSQRQEAEREVEAAIRGIEEAESEIKAARRRWQNALAACGLPKQLSPREVRHLGERHQEVHALQRRLRQARLEHDERRKEFDALSGRVAQVFVDAELEPEALRVTDRLKQLRQALEKHQEIAARRDALDQRLRRVHRRQARLVHGIDRWQHRRQLLFAQAGIRDENDYLQRLEDGRLLESLRGQQAAVTREIAAALGLKLTEDDVRDWLEGPYVRQLETHWEELASGLQGTNQRLQALFEQRGSVQQELKSLAEDRRLPQRFIDLGVIDQRLRDAVEQWQVVAATNLVLDAVRKLYESERQPETLQEASRYLERLTDGHYTRVWTPLGENLLKVDDAEGRPLPVEVLSRGTREQLFLALRLALVSSYARRGIELPLVLDDVLVNFDAKRAKAAAAVLRDFAAAGHQLFVFTCHEHVWKLFKNLKLSARRLPAGDDDAATLAYHSSGLDRFEDEDDEESLEPAARWQPDDVGAAPIQVEDDEYEDDAFSWEDAEDELEDEFEDEEAAVEADAEDPIDDYDEDDDYEEASEVEELAEIEAEEEEDESDFEPEPPRRREPLPKVTVVRSRSGPFDNALWFEPVEDDLDDEPQMEPVDDGEEEDADGEDDEEGSDESEAFDEAESAWGEMDDSDDDVEAA